MPIASLSTATFSFCAVLVVSLICILTTDKTVQFSFTVIYILVFILIMFLFLLNIYMNFQTTATVLNTFFAVGAPLGVIGICIQLLYYLFSNSSNIIANRVDNSFMTFMYAQITLIGILSYFIYSFINNFSKPLQVAEQIKASALRVREGLKQSFIISIIFIGILMMSVNSFIHTVLVNYKADG